MTKKSLWRLPLNFKLKHRDAIEAYLQITMYSLISIQYFDNDEYLIFHYKGGGPRNKTSMRVVATNNHFYKYLDNLRKEQISYSRNIKLNKILLQK